VKFLATAVALLLSVASAGAFAQGDPPLDGRLKKINDSKSIAIAYRADATPFSFEDSNKQVVGYTIDLCRRIVGAIERQLNVGELKIQWVPVTVQNRFDTIAKGRADMECGSSTVTLSRMKMVDFSSFIFVDGTGVLVKSSIAANGLGDLGGKKIGVIGGTTNERALNEALKRRVVNANVVLVKSSDEALAQLESGALDAFVSDRLLLVGLATKSKDPASLALLADALSFEPYAITLPRGDWQMRLAVNSALSMIYRTGAIGEIFNRWFGSFGKPGPLTEATFGFGAIPE
jgi:ABC-type amino acid transport substrate-binding protein